MTSSVGAVSPRVGWATGQPPGDFLPDCRGARRGIRRAGAGRRWTGDSALRPRAPIHREVSMAIKVAINGFGRIGRLVFRHGFEDDAARLRRRERHHQPGSSRSPSQVRLDTPPFPRRRETGQGRDQGREQDAQSARRDGSGQAAVGQARTSTSSSSRPAASPSATTRPSTSRRARRRC